MSDQEIKAIHEKAIKGVTGKLLLYGAGFLIFWTFTVAVVYKGMEDHNIDTDKVLSKISLQIDTMSARQEHDHFALHDVIKDVQAIKQQKQNNQNINTHFGLALQRVINGKRYFIPVGK